MTLRKTHSEELYKIAKKNDPKHLTKEELVKDFEYWVIVVNRFPWDRIVDKIHHMIVLKRDVCLEDITIDELTELWYTILPYANSEYDSVTVNMTSMRSVHCTPHIHAYKLKPELK